MRSNQALFAAGLVGLLVAAGACTSLLGGFSTSASAGGTDGGDGGGNGAGADDTGTHADDTGTHADEGGAHDGGGDSGDAGPLKVGSCTAELVHNITGDEGGVDDEQLTIFAQQPVSDDEVTVLVTQSMGDSTHPPQPGVAYQFRSDRPSDPPQQVVVLQNNTNSAPLIAATRSWDNSATYVLAADQPDNLLLFYNWPDTMNIGGAPTTVPSNSIGNGNPSMAAASASGLFYGWAFNDNNNDGGAVYEEFVGQTGPNGTPTVVATVPSGMQVRLGDQPNTYVLADGSVMLLYKSGTSNSATLMQAQVSPTAVLKTQAFQGPPMEPVAFQADPVGSGNVDVTVAEAVGDAANMSFALFTGTMPESHLFTSALATSLKEVDTSVLGPLGQQKPCVASYPGKLAIVLPAASGFDMVIIDVKTATIDYSLVGSSNLLHGTTMINNCALGTPQLQGGIPTFDLVWTETNLSGTTVHPLFYARIACAAE